MSKSVYLAGPITGLSYGEAVDWRQGVSDELGKSGIVGLSPMRGKQYLLEASKISDSYDDKVLSTQAAITARDRFDVMECDVVLFNFLGAQKVSIGTCIEVGWADAFRKPGILVIEDGVANIHEHAMIRQICGWRTNSLEQAVAIAKAILVP